MGLKGEEFGDWNEGGCLGTKGEGGHWGLETLVLGVREEVGERNLG